jgi:beta-galactosidase
MARRLAERYGKHPALKIWHVSNEYGGNDIGARCFCPLCVKAFRGWLQERYENLETLNSRWDTAFWGKTFRHWEQIEPPFQIGEKSIQALSLDYSRFQNESLLACYCGEAETLREITPHVPITTNLMGAYEPLDYHLWAQEMDVASFDNYPGKDATYAETAFNLALTRGCAEANRGYW